MSSSNVSESSDLVSKSNTKSAVWKHFGFKADEDGKPKDEDVAICRICHKTVVAKGRQFIKFINASQETSSYETFRCKEGE